MKIRNPVADIDFPDSGWTLSITKNGNAIVMSLHWRYKSIPTHQTVVSIDNFKNVLKTLDIL